jgi:hypothetical protein
VNLVSAGPTIRITLSRRNLDTLIRMLDVQVGNPTLKRIVADDIHLYVTAEEDAEHYDSNDRQPEVRGVRGIGPEHVAALAPVPILTDEDVPF